MITTKQKSLRSIFAKHIGLKNVDVHDSTSEKVQALFTALKKDIEAAGYEPLPPNNNTEYPNYESYTYGTHYKASWLPNDEKLNISFCHHQACCIFLYTKDTGIWPETFKRRKIRVAHFYEPVK